MGLSRPTSLPTVKRWLKTSFAKPLSSSSSSSVSSTKRIEEWRNDMDESPSTSVDDTVSLYDDSHSGGTASYNFSPLQDERLLSAATTEPNTLSSECNNISEIRRQRPPSLSVMLSELQSDVAPSSSIMTEIVMSLSNVDIGRDRLTPMLFATAADAYDEVKDSTMHLLSFEDDDGYDNRDDIGLVSDRGANESRVEHDAALLPWRTPRRSSNRCEANSFSPEKSSTVSSKLHKPCNFDSSDPVHVYNARKNLDDGPRTENSVAHHLGKHNQNLHRQREEAQLTDDCTLSSAETALVSNRSADNAKRDLSKAKQRSCARASGSIVAKKKLPTARKTRWITALRGPRYLHNSQHNLSSVSEEYGE